MGASRKTGGPSTSITRHWSLASASRENRSRATYAGTKAVHAAASAPDIAAATTIPAPARAIWKSAALDVFRDAAHPSQPPWCLSTYAVNAPPPKASTAAATAPKTAITPNTGSAASVMNCAAIVSNSAQASMGRTIRRWMSASL